MVGSPDEVRHFDAFLAKLPHPVKVVIAGNHEITFDIGKYQKNRSRFPLQNVDNPRTAKELLRHCTYLEDSQMHVFGYTIVGSPWVHCSGWAFHCPTRAEIAQKWAQLPGHTDILLTHMPPYRVLDADLTSGDPSGCPHLLAKVREIKPIVHVFGHMHEGQGVLHTEETMFVNASVCNYEYQPVNLPTVFDLPIR